MAERETILSLPDMDLRDPNDLNSHVKVQFEDVIGEPGGVRSMDCVWLNSYRLFECSKSVCYRTLTTLCGLCIAVMWGCEFGLTTFTHVWCLTPSLRRFAINIAWLQKVFGLYIQCCLNPVCEACGILFSQINVRKV